MSLPSLVLALLVIGVVVWLLNAWVPMGGAIKRVLNLLVMIAVVTWLLLDLGVIGHGTEIRFPTVR